MYLVCVHMYVYVPSTVAGFGNCRIGPTSSHHSLEESDVELVMS